MTGQQRFADRLAQERRIRSVLEWRDVPQSEIAAAVGTSAENYSKWETGRAVPRDDETVRRLAAYFGVTIAWLRYGEEPRQLPAPATVDVGGHSMPSLGEIEPFVEPPAAKPARVVGNVNKRRRR